MRFLATGVVFLASCAALKPLPKQLLACEKAAALDNAQALYNAASAALALPTHADAQMALDALVTSQGEAAACAVAAVVQDLETTVGSSVPTPAVSSNGPGDWVRLVRGHAWLSSQPFRGQPVPRLWGL